MPLYLEALLEFGSNSADAIPNLPAQQLAKIKDREKRFDKLYLVWDKERGDVPPELEKVLNEYSVGFTKLAKAQTRPRCVFQMGVTIEASASHAQTSRTVGRIATIQACRDLEKNRIDLAIGRIEPIFRLTRDLRPRGPAICQLVAVATEDDCYRNIIMPVLSHPKLKANDCLRLLALLKTHESQLADSYIQSVYADYVMMRGILLAFLDGIHLEIVNGKMFERRVDREGVGAALNELFWVVKTNEILTNGPDQAQLPDKSAFINPEKNRVAVNLLERIKPDHNVSLKLLDLSTKLLIQNNQAPYSKRLSDLKKFLESEVNPPGIDSRIIYQLILPDQPSAISAIGRGKTYLAAAQARVAIKHWQLTKKEPPVDLAKIMSHAGFPPVPIDPFDNKPMKLAEINGELVVYSVGADGVDDKGLKDSDLGRKPEGDFLFPMPKPIAAKTK